MSFQKNKLTKYGVIANYHTITAVAMNFNILPTPQFDEHGDLTGYIGGSDSFVTISIFKDKAAYDAKSAPLEQKVYKIDFLSTIGAVRSTDKTCETAAYDLVKASDSFYSDATTVD